MFIVMLSCHQRVSTAREAEGCISRTDGLHGWARRPVLMLMKDDERWIDEDDKDKDEEENEEEDEDDEDEDVDEYEYEDD